MIAYFIMVHRYPDQFKKLFKAIYDTKNYYLIHIDKGSSKQFYQETQDFLLDYPNTHILKSQNIVWGGYSMVDAELKGIKTLLGISAVWDHYINLSGQDFPLKSQSFIMDYLNQNKGKNFLLVSDQAKKRPNTLNRIKNYFVESKLGFIGKPVKRKFLSKTTPYIGGQWKILSRECCEFISTSPQVSKFKKYYRNTLIPDESFFQTVLMNTDYTGTIINNDKRAIIWVPDITAKLKFKRFTDNETKALVASGKIKLRPKVFTINDLTYLKLSTALFARKFDELIDSAIMQSLESGFIVSKKPQVQQETNLDHQNRLIN